MSFIYQVESCNEGYPGCVIHTSCNIELAYQVFINKDAGEFRYLNIIWACDGTEAKFVVDEWNKDSLTLDDVKKVIDSCYK